VLGESPVFLRALRGDFSESVAAKNLARADARPVAERSVVILVIDPRHQSLSVSDMEEGGFMYYFLDPDDIMSEVV
jgi:hypothetical protein